MKRNLINRAFSVAFIAISLLIPMKGYTAACNAIERITFLGVGGGCTLGYYETGCQVWYDDGGGPRNYTAKYATFNAPAPAAGGNAAWTDNGTCGASSPTLSLTTGEGSLTCISATAGGTVDTDGDASGIAERGLAWNTATAPETSDNKVIEGGTTTGLFAATAITGLTGGVQYFVRPYAINGTGDIGYGPEINFTTLSGATLGATTSPTNIKVTTATSGGNITSSPCATITERGICWQATFSGPDINDDKAVEGGTTTGVFSANMTGLTPGALYYVRSYATAGGVTSYGTNVQFYTGTAGTLTTLDAIDVHCESFTTGMNSIVEGRVGGLASLGALASAALEYGVLYGVNTTDVSNSTPSVLVGATIKEVHISNNAASLDATIVDRYMEITGVTAATTYYNKAYATYAADTYYGDVEDFTTAAACDVYYSCAYDADVDNRWSLLADCSTADGDALVASNLNAICYHRHDWLSAAITDMDADIATEAVGQAMTAIPYRLVCQSGSRVCVNNPTWIGGFQLEVQANAQFSHNGTIDMGIDGVDSDAQGQVARLSNAGSILVRGAYTNALKLTGTGEFCVRGTFTQTATAPGSINGDFTSPPSLPTTRYNNGNCVGTSTLPIELLSFEVEKENDQVNVAWVTGSEINNDYFEVYASADGIVWESIAVVNGAGNSFIVNKYSTIDNDIKGYTVKYYKLKQVDFDGTTSFSKMKVVDFSGVGGINHAYDDGEYLHVFYSGIKGPVELSMYDVHSRNVQLGGVLIEGAETKHMMVKKEALTPGIYFIQLRTASQAYSYKLHVK